MDTVDADAIASAGFKVVLDYSYGSTSFVMPNVLAKLGADVLAVNPYASTAGAAAFDRSPHAGRWASWCGRRAPTSGAVIDPDGEHITLVDDSGHVLETTRALFAILSRWCASAHDKPTVALPVSVSQAAERDAPTPAPRSCGPSSRRRTSWRSA